jgi:hypothetical protein
MRDDLHAGLEGNAVLFRANKRIVRNPEYCSLAATRNGAAAASITSTLPIWGEYLTRVPMSPCLPRHAGELDLTWTCRKDRAE